MRRVVVAGLLWALPVWCAATAAADPGPEPAPPPPPVLGDPALLLGPLDQMAPIALLNPETYRVPDEDQPSPYALTQGVPPGPFGYVNGLKGLHAMLYGSMGRMPGDELGAALPGTAPPPGTALPPGLEQFLPAPGQACPAGQHEDAETPGFQCVPGWCPEGTLLDGVSGVCVAAPGVPPPPLR